MKDFHLQVAPIADHGDRNSARQRFFEHLRAITPHLVFPDRNSLVDAKPPPGIAARIAG